MKLDTSFDYKKTLVNVGNVLSKNRIIVVSLLILASGVYSLNRISELSQPETDTKYLQEKVSELKVVKFDEDAIKRIQELNSSNIEIESNFTDRNNPFGE